MYHRSNQSPEQATIRVLTFGVFIVFGSASVVFAVLPPCPESVLLPADGGGFFGASVDIDGDWAIVGAYQGSGVAYIFQRSGGVWSQSAMLVNPLPGPGSNDNFGARLAIQGGYAFVGSPNGNDELGYVFVYHWSGVTWDLTQTLTTTESGFKQHFGMVYRFMASETFRLIE